jgi:hypothetical protein
MQDAFALGIGIGTRAGDGRWLEVFYAEPVLHPDAALVRAIIEASENGADHDADPVQFALPRTGHLVDLATFSRRRTVNADSSFTVMG